MWRGPRKFFAITLVAFVWTGPLAAQPAEETSSAILEVSGEGRASVAPDMATIHLGVVAEAETPGDAVDAMEAPMNALLDALAGLEIDPRDIQTGELRLNPVYSEGEALPDGRPRIAGFEALSDVRVQVRDIDALGTVMGAALDAGSNRFDGLTFGLSDPRGAVDAALADAMDDAMRKASVLAEASGRTLGPIVHVTEIAGGGGPGPAMMNAAMERAVPVAPGSVETSARVQLRYELAQ